MQQDTGTVRDTNLSQDDRPVTPKCNRYTTLSKMEGKNEEKKKNEPPSGRPCKNMVNAVAFMPSSFL